MAIYNTTMWRDYNQNEKIEGVDDEMQLLMHSLFNSIQKVTKNYLYWSISEIEDENIPYVERAFAYELYFQWNLNEDVENTPLYKLRDKFKINAEIRKDLVENLTSICSYSYPDMVLHGGNGSSNNYILCEIKRKSTIRCNKDSLVKDINKLGFFLRRDLHLKYDVDWKEYKYGVFILTDKYWGNKDFDLNPSDIANNIDFEELEVDKSLYSHIICVLYNGKTLQYGNLGDIEITKKQ